MTPNGCLDSAFEHPAHDGGQRAIVVDARTMVDAQILKQLGQSPQRQRVPVSTHINRATMYDPDLPGDGARDAAAKSVDVAAAMLIISRSSGDHQVACSQPHLRWRCLRLAIKPCPLKPNPVLGDDQLDRDTRMLRSRKRVATGHPTTTLRRRTLPS